MSKAFTKEDGGDEPVVVPPRAPLPPGVPNYVTARGLALLRAELATLEAERARLAADAGDDVDRPRRLALANGRLAELSARVASAELVDPRAQAQDEVRFGARVRLRTLDDSTGGTEREIRIVGVDEAAPASGRVAFLAPIARAILGLRVGDEAIVELPRGEEAIEIVAIAYDESPIG